MAFAKNLFGDVNPSGKLPFTYPKHTGSFIPYDHKYTEILDINFGKEGFDPQWEFGFGLSYSNFTYSNLNVGKTKYSSNDTISVSIEITNSSSLNGKEVIQVFVSDTVASITPSVKRLRAFKKVLIEANSSQTVEFNIPISELAFVNLNNKWVVEPGCFVIKIGDLEKAIVVE